MDVENLPVVTWQPAPPILSDDCPVTGAVQLWRISLSRALIEIDTLAQILSPDEQQRANRFKFDRHRWRFIAARASLRQILGQYLGQQPAMIQFEYGSTGKPSLLDSGASPDGGTLDPWLRRGLQFNLSHSEDLALLGITWEQTIGIDLEQIRPVAVLELAERFFCPREMLWLSQLLLAQQIPAFFQIWTAKEAYLKAIGLGITGLQQVELCFGPNQSGPNSIARREPVLLQFISEGTGTWALPGGRRHQVSKSDHPNWHIQNLIPAPGWMAAIATSGPIKSIQGWLWPPHSSQTLDKVL